MPDPKRDDFRAQFYAGYSDDVAYQHDEGLLVLRTLGVTGEGSEQEYTDPVVVRVGNPLTFKTRRASGTKDKTPPVLPKPKADEVVLTSSFYAPLPQISGAAPPGFKFSAVTTYTTLETGPVGVDSGYNLGDWPFTFPSVEYERAQLGGNTPTVIDALPVDLMNPLYPAWPYMRHSHQWFDAELGLASPAA